MASDNGKSGQVDMYDVWAAMSYIEEHYDGTIQLTMECSPSAGWRELLCSLTFVPNDATRFPGAGILLEVPAGPTKLRLLPRSLHDAVLHLQENLDGAPPHSMVFGILRA